MIIIIINIKLQKLMIRFKPTSKYRTFQNTKIMLRVLSFHDFLPCVCNKKVTRNYSMITVTFLIAKEQIIKITELKSSEKLFLKAASKCTNTKRLDF